MQDLNIPQSYGIEGTIAIIDTANTLYDGFKQVTEDGKVDYMDSTVLFSAGPKLFASLSAVVAKRGDLSGELGDLDDKEIETILQKAGSRIENDSYKKILKGLILAADGIVEALKAA